MRRSPLLVVVLAGACGTDGVMVQPVLVVPDDVFDMIDELEISVARAGNPRDLSKRSFARGEPVELFDVPFGEDLVIHLTGYNGGAPVGYGRTCAFDVTLDVVPTPHLYFALMRAHAVVDVMPAIRVGGTGASFEGSALMFGGRAGDAATLDVERFDPATNELLAAGRLSERTDAVAAHLGTRLAVLGGQVGQAEGATFIELLDGQGLVDERTTDTTARVGLTATSLTDGRVIVIGGHAPGGAPEGRITALALQGGDLDARDVNARLVTPRTGHTATALDDDDGAPLLIAGGVDALGMPVAVAELYRPLRDDLSTATPALNVPRRRHQAVRMPDDSVLIIGGVDAAGSPVRAPELYSADQGFVRVPDLPQIAGIVDMTVTTLPDGRILLTGGRTTEGGAPTNQAFIAQFAEGKFDVIPTDDLALPRAGHQAALLCDGTVLISGGTDAADPAERYNPIADGRR